MLVLNSNPFTILNIYCPLLNIQMLRNSCNAFPGHFLFTAINSYEWLGFLYNGKSMEDLLLNLYGCMHSACAHLSPFGIAFIS